MKRALRALFVASAFALVAVPGTASAKPLDSEDGVSTGDPALNFEGMTTRFSVGMDCAAVPIGTKAGDTLSLSMLITSDSSARTATVQYFAPIFPGFAMPVGEGKIMVLKGSWYHDDYTQWNLVAYAERTGPPARLRDTCLGGAHTNTNQAEVVHLRRLKRPSLQTINAWCAENQLSSGSSSACPTYLAG